LNGGGLNPPKAKLCRGQKSDDKQGESIEP